MNKITFDKYGFLDFTQDNIELIETCISIDSRYRKAFDVTSEEGSAWYIKNRLDFNDELTVKEVCKQIDKENSTHLYVSGNEKGAESDNNQGLDNMVKKINEVEDIESLIVKGDLGLVDFLAKATNGIYKPSFASKFCTYVSRYKYGLDNYSIYDNVLQRTLPYYAWIYLGEKYIARTKSSIDIKPDCISRKDGVINCYEDYFHLIERLILRINEVRELKVNKEIFDHMLWYYYKGDEPLIKKSLEVVREEEEPLFFHSNK